jgi:hypothetical protein
MNPTNTSSVRPSHTKALLAMGCALSLALFGVPALNAADSAVTLKPMADKAPALPLSHSFKKVEGGEKGPYVITLKNDSKAALKVTTKILLAVAFHGEDKARHLPAHSIDAGASWTISDLAAEDIVVLSADGFETLKIVVK